MSRPILFSLIQTPEHPRFSHLYEELGYTEMQFSSVRKLVSALKKHQPDVIVAEFLYAFASNYASNHICNLDTLLITLQQYTKDKPQFIFLIYKDEVEYLKQLTDHYQAFSKGNHTLIVPAKEQQMKELLKKCE